MASSPQYLHAPIILLKEGVDTSQGRAQIISNINACQSVVGIVRSTLGPRGMDKLIYTDHHVTITNDGATVVDLLNVVHPAARVLVDIAKAQDAEIGDGTTSVVVLAGEFLSEAKLFLEEGVAPQIIIKGFQRAAQEALKKLKEIEINIAENKTTADKRQLLRKCASTALSSKLVAPYRGSFATMVVDAVLMLENDLLDKSMIGIKKVAGGSVASSFLVNGVAFKKTFSYAGFEQQPKTFNNPKVLLLNIELELKAEKENAEIRISNPQDYQSIVDAEWKSIYNKLELIKDTGAKVVLSRLPIGDLATQYFASYEIFCAGRVEEADLRRTALATGAAIQSTLNGVNSTVLGTCGKFEEAQIGSERYNLFTDCPNAKSSTFILRGGGQQFIDEAERSLNDAIMIVRRMLKSHTVVGGGGAIEMELSSYLRGVSRSVSGKEQLIINAYAKALECIPRALAQNTGLNQVHILNTLRQEHHQNRGRWYGINCLTGEVCDTFEEYIWEPSIMKLHAIEAATEATCLILSIDETIKNPKSTQENASQPAMPPGKNIRQRGRRI